MYGILTYICLISLSQGLTCVFLGITYLVGKTKITLWFHAPKWLSKWYVLVNVGKYTSRMDPMGRGIDSKKLPDSNYHQRRKPIPKSCKYSPIVCMYIHTCFFTCRCQKNQSNMISLFLLNPTSKNQPTKKSYKPQLPKIGKENKKHRHPNLSHRKIPRKLEDDPVFMVW